MRELTFIGTMTVLALAVDSVPSRAATSGLTRVASGLSLPVFATHVPGDRDRLFIAELGSPLDSVAANAAIKILDLNTGSVLSTPFLTISDLDTYGEGGLLGMAFHPDYSTNGKFYVYVTIDPDGTQMTENPPMVSEIREYTVSSNSNVADTTFRTILSYNQPQNNHNGGWIGFGPNDGYLYIAWGDGGGGNDDDGGHTSGIGNAQDTTNNLLGKILRIDVNDPDPNTGPNYAIPPTNPFKAGVGDPADDVGDDEIWAYGLRNPFRASFDRISGDLWIGDVGQDNREEIDFQPSTSTGGENYGWRLREGDIATPGGVGGSCATCVEPIYSYTHPNTSVPPVSPLGFTGNLVTGGYVYRGPDPSLQGKYFFLDAGGNNHWLADTEPSFGNVMNIDSLLTPDIGSTSNPVSFGEDAVGNLYIVYLGSGAVYRIATNQLIAGDYNADGEVDSGDEARWRQTLGTAGANLPSDGNKNGIVDAADYVVLRKFFGTSVHDGVASGSDSVPEPAFAAIAGQIIAVGLLVTERQRRRHRQ